ncbi:hypothetical protein BH10BAC4_BH10BAC4_24960 [soil metagenome]
MKHLLFIFLCFFSTVAIASDDPETILPKTKVIQSVSWYSVQAKNWKERIDRNSTDAEKLKSLKSIIRKEQRGAFAWYNLIQLKVPAYVTALLVIFSGMVGWIGLPVGKKEIATLPPVKSDTIFVTKVDTVFKERIVYRQPVNVIAASLKKGEPAELQQKSKPTSVGVSMKDKEELNKLLVSGSE